MKPDNEKPATLEQEKVVFIVRVIDLPIAEVWKAWTDPESFKKWWGPAAYTCPYCEVDLRVGGRNLNCMRSPEGKDVWNTGTYMEIEAQKRLVYIDNFSDKQGNSVPASYYEMDGVWGTMKVTVTLQVQGKRTKMTLEHTGIPEEAHHDCVIGWNESFNKMEVSLKKTDD